MMKYSACRQGSFPSGLEIFAYLGNARTVLIPIVEHQRVSDKRQRRIRSLRKRQCLCPTIPTESRIVSAPDISAATYRPTSVHGPMRFARQSHAILKDLMHRHSTSISSSISSTLIFSIASWASRSLACPRSCSFRVCWMSF